MEDHDSHTRTSGDDQPLEAVSHALSDSDRKMTSINDNNINTYEMIDTEAQENSNEYEQLQINAAYVCATNTPDAQDGQKREDDHYVKVTMKALKKILIATVLANSLMLVSIIAAVIALSVFTYHQSITATNPNIAPSQVQQLEATTQENISQLLEKLDVMQEEVISLQGQLFCGAGQWHRVAYLNMKDPTEQCPPTWREYNENGVRACGRPFSTKGSCATTSYSSGYEYSKVCGRVIGYQVASPDAFARFGDDGINIDGVNITSGEEHQHIWSFIAGVTDGLSSRSGSNCPCSNVSDQQSGPQPYIDNNFFCESGNPSNNDIIYNQFFSTDPLWDGQQCEGTCCNGTNSPPWFSVQLPVPTDGEIQVSICGDEFTDNEDTPIGLLEIFVR